MRLPRPRQLRSAARRHLPLGITIRTFCEAHKLSQAMYFKLKAGKRGPRETAVGSRRYITFEDAAKWRGQQQEVTAA
jgi:predicted transcriptional regulator